jgi:hypothetical protein
MKKVLIIGFILVILLLAFSQGVMAAPLDTTDVAVSAQIESVSTIDAVGPEGVWSLGRGDNTLNEDNSPCITVTVDSNLHYNVQASASNDGYMTDTGGDAFTAPFFLETWSFETTNPQTIVSNGALGNAVITDYTISQAIDNDDSANLAHSITLTFDLVAL